MAGIEPDYDTNGQVAFRRRLYEAYRTRLRSGADVASWSATPSNASAVETFVAYLRGDVLPRDPSNRARFVLDEISRLDADDGEFEQIAAYWRTGDPIVDPVLVDRCRFGLQHYKGDHQDEVAANARALTAVANHIGASFSAEVADALQRPVDYIPIKAQWTPQVPRADLLVDWRIGGRGRPGIRIWIDERGMSIGASAPRASSKKDGWNVDAPPILFRHRIEGFEPMRSRRSNIDGDDGYFGGQAGDVIYARWFQPDELVGLDLRTATVDAARAVRPFIEDLLAAGAQQQQRSEPSPPMPEAAPPTPVAPTSPSPLEATPPEAPPRIEVPRALWVDALLASTPYREQMARIRRSNLDDERVAATLSLLHARQGVATFAAIANATGQSASRIGGFLAVLAQCLNGLGDTVMVVDPATAEARLDERMLCELFGVPSV